MNKKNAPEQKPQSANDHGNHITHEQIYNLLRSGSLVTVEHPADLIPIGRFLALYELGVDDGRLDESLVSVRDLLTFGRIRVQEVAQ